MQAEFDPKIRAEEKQLSRDDDAKAIKTGKKDREQLWAENSLIKAAPGPIDFSKIPSMKKALYDK